MEDILKTWTSTMHDWCLEDCTPREDSATPQVYAGFMALECSRLANQAWEQDPKRQHRNVQLTLLYQPVSRLLQGAPDTDPTTSVAALVRFLVATSGRKQLEEWSKASRERVHRRYSRRI